MLQQKMIRFSSLALAGAATIACSFFVNQTKAFAGEGGVAAAVSFTFEGKNASSVSAATAMGKTDAAAVTFGYNGTNADNTSAAALGASSPITIGAIDNDAGTLKNLSSSGKVGDQRIGTAQANEISTENTFGVKIGNASVNYKGNGKTTSNRR